MVNITTDRQNRQTSQTDRQTDGRTLMSPTTGHGFHTTADRQDGQTSQTNQTDRRADMNEPDNRSWVSYNGRRTRQTDLPDRPDRQTDGHE